MIPPVVASERGRAQTVYVAMHRRGSRTTSWYSDHERNVLRLEPVLKRGLLHHVAEQPLGLVCSVC